MAIDDSTNYTLTGAQVKDLAARIKGAAGAVIYYVGETFFTDGATGESVYSDSALTTTVTATAMATEAEAGKLLYLFELDSRNDVVSIHEISYVAPPGMDDGEFSVLYGTSIWDIFYVPGTGWSVNEKPIPTVNNATLTIQHNGTTVNTFTANASTNKTANVETIYADPIASSAAITPLVQTSMIADGAVTGGKIANSTITPGKIDWTSMGSFGPTGGPSSATAKSLPGNYEFVSFFTKDVSLKAGTYLAIFQSLLNVYGSTVQEINARCLDTTNNNTVIAGGWAVPAVNGWQQVIGLGEYTVPSDGTHTISYGMSSSAAVSDARFSANRTQVSFIRIG